MKTLVDENIPLATELFGQLGEVTVAPGREITPDFPGIGEFDALAIRSVTDVTPELVDAAGRARFIGTATIGTDHIDADYVERANRTRRNPIRVVSAPGSNADSVADYVLLAIAHLADRSGTFLCGRSLGVVGHGNCGSRVARRAAAFGMRVLRYDPPLAGRDPAFTSHGFEETMAADFVTCHVPLTRTGESQYPTYHMIDAGALALMKPGAVLVNSSRGAVVDSAALAHVLRQRTIEALLDVYEGEPVPPGELIELPALATPHIAGYAIEAKRRGAVVIYEKMCRTFGVEPHDSTPLLMRGFHPPHDVPLHFEAAADVEKAAEVAARLLLRTVYDIGATSAELKATADRADRGELFDRMRKNYARDHARHELASYRVGIDDAVAEPVRRGIRARLSAFGTEIRGQDAHYVLAPLPGAP